MAQTEIVPSLESHVQATFGGSFAADLASNREWPKLEIFLAKTYFALASFFSSSEYAEVPWNDNRIASLQIPNLGRLHCAEHVQYLAVNFRGLYRGHGRITVLAPFGLLRQRQPDPERHRALHSLYLDVLSRRSESFNQVFLATSQLPSFSAAFTTALDTSLLQTDGDRAITQVVIGSDVAAVWKEYEPEWQAIIETILNGNASTLELRERLGATRTAIVSALRSHGRSLLASSFFQSWNSLPHEPGLDSALDAAARFEYWLLSLSWLAFYCRAAHAGPFFYTAQLPDLVPVDVPKGFEAIPASSISLVAGKELCGDCRQVWSGFSRTLSQAAAFQDVRQHVRGTLEELRTARRHHTAEGREEELLTFVTSLGEQQQAGHVLPVHAQKLQFLLRMARQLVEQRHEQHQLHFAFIFGFSWERVDAESTGWLTEVVSGLTEQWEQFRAHIVDPRNSIVQAEHLGADYVDAGVTVLANGMAKWIKTGDLPLQPWDMAVFFEENHDLRWPVPASIVRVSWPQVRNRGSIDNEFQLRQALKQFTKTNRGVVAVVVAHKGLVLFAHGKAILVRARNDADFDEEFLEVGIHLRSDTHSPTFASEDDDFREFLYQQTANGGFREVDADLRRSVCDFLVQICEALVTLGHGALIVLRTQDDGGDDLPPLNPVWQVRPADNAPDFADSILLYALLAALDGATEIRLPKQRGPVSFVARRNAIARTPVWVAGADGDTVQPAYTIPPIALVGKGTRHHSALALSSDLKEALVLTVSADGPVTVWQGGKKLKDDSRFKP